MAEEIAPGLFHADVPAASPPVADTATPQRTLKAWSGLQTAVNVTMPNQLAQLSSIHAATARVLGGS